MFFVFLIKEAVTGDCYGGIELMKAQGGLAKHLGDTLYNIYANNSSHSCIEATLPLQGESRLSALYTEEIIYKFGFLELQFVLESLIPWYFNFFSFWSFYISLYINFVSGFCALFSFTVIFVFSGLMAYTRYKIYVWVDYFVPISSF